MPGAPGRFSLQPVRSEPLLVTAVLPPGVLAWADRLRDRNYPPERERLGAHVTLFHGLPPSAGGVVHSLLAEAARGTAPDAEVTGVMDLGKGTAIEVCSPALVALHEDLAERLSGLIQQRDARPLRLHITVQNKVARADAQALQRELALDFRASRFHFHGLGLYAWDGELWQFRKEFPFRGTT